MRTRDISKANFRVLLPLCSKEEVNASWYKKTRVQKWPEL
ncbi:unnamed protein product [Brassica oleracea]